MPPLLAQQTVPTPAVPPGSPAGEAALRQGTGLTALTISLAAVMLVCIVALLSWYRRRVLVLSRARSLPKPTKPVDAWAEAAKRLTVEPRDRPGPHQ